VTGPDQGEGGQAAVELALVLPLLLVVALAGLQVALVARDQVLLVHAAREGARQAAVSDDDASVVTSARTATALAGARLDVRTGRLGRSGTVTVRATYRSPTDVPLVGGLLGDVRLGAAATMRSER
jgi:Flp pilus assembly protein TadG